jgi:diaminopimelate decarboxylase
VTTPESRPSHESMDWRLGITDHSAIPVPCPSSNPHLGERAQGPVSLRLLPDTSQVRANGHLVLGGCDVVELAAVVGTPLFIYDEEHLRNRCREAHWGFGDGIAYASKAFLCKAMATLVDQEGMMIDVSSGGEMYVALSAGVPPERLILHGSNKSAGELTLALALGLGRIVVDSFDEIERLERLATHVSDGARLRVLLRVNPGVDASTHPSVSTGQEDSRFGLSIASGAASEAIRRLTQEGSPLELIGLHTHIGSQILDLSPIRRTVHHVAPLLLTAGLHELCIGGGLGVPYTFEDPQAPSLSDWSRTVHEECRSAGIPQSVRITAEPGRAIAATAAVTCYTIGTIKSVKLVTDWADNDCSSEVRNYVSVDGGMSDNPRPALYGSRYEAFLPRETAARRTFPVVVGGKHCESGDILIPDGQLPEDTRVGDILTMPVTGAYGYAMTSNYNKLLRPPVVFVRDGDYRIVTRRETYRDLLRLDA